MMDEKILGIDEAGRGCVMGPMALGAVLVDSNGWNALIEIGVKDSKQLTPKKRESLAPQIEKIAISTKVHLADPATIDQYCNKHLLNVLEAEIAASLILELNPATVYIDAPGKEGLKFFSQLQNALNQLESGSASRYDIIAENFADIRYPAVSAASILAKVARDKAISDLHKEIGDFGSGYPSDSDTILFLKNYYQTRQCLPPCARKSWHTTQKIKQEQPLLF